MAKNEEQNVPRFVDRVSVYGLELAVAMVTLIISASVLSIASYALGNYLAGELPSIGAGYFALWMSASTIVWVPVALLFYLRSRAYMAAHPEVAANPVQRTFVIIYQVFVILVIISFALSAVYTTLMSLVKADDTSNLLLGGALPSAVSALIFGGALVAFFKRPVVRRKTFALVFLGVSLLVIVPTIVLSIISLRSLNSDEARAADLYELRLAIDEAGQRDDNILPKNLAAVADELDKETKDRLSDYTYKRTDNTRYELCTSFETDSNRANKYYASKDSSSSYVDFRSHDAGSRCFKLRLATPSVYDYYYDVER